LIRLQALENINHFYSKKSMEDRVKQFGTWDLALFFGELKYVIYNEAPS